LSGHPMDEFLPILRQRHIPALSRIMESVSSGDGNFRDEQLLTVAGVVQSVKTKTTRNNTLMAYVTIEDASAPMEMLVFSGPLGRFGTLLREGCMIVVDGKLSLRDDKDPQLVVNQVRELAELLEEPAPKSHPAPQAEKLYLKIPSESSKEFALVCAVLEMFVGQTPVVLFFADTRLRRGTTCQPDEGMLAELRRILGDESVVLQMKDR